MTATSRAFTHSVVKVTSCHSFILFRPSFYFNGPVWCQNFPHFSQQVGFTCPGEPSGMIERIFLYFLSYSDTVLLGVCVCGGGERSGFSRSAPHVSEEAQHLWGRPSTVVGQKKSLLCANVYESMEMKWSTH